MWILVAISMIGFVIAALFLLFLLIMNAGIALETIFEDKD